MNDKQYWVVEVECRDEIRNLHVSLWQFQVVLLEWGKTLQEIEHGAAIVQSKGMRKVIMSIVPPQLRKIWIRAYLEGAEEFDPALVSSIPGGREGFGGLRNGKALPPAKKDKKPPSKKKDTPPKDDGKKKPPSQGGMDLQKAAGQLTTKLKASAPEVIEFSASSAFNNQGQATVQFVRALTAQPEFNKLKKKFDDWKAAKEKAEKEKAEGDGVETE